VTCSSGGSIDIINGLRGQVASTWDPKLGAVKVRASAPTPAATTPAQLVFAWVPHGGTVLALASMFGSDWANERESGGWVGVFA
jgi:hypothetical protein